MLNRVTYGNDATKPPLLIAHGLFGSARNWGAIARRLADDRRVVAVDMRNHGESFWSDEHDYPAMAEDLAQVIVAEGGRMDVLGHSMGGKAVMTLALTHGDLVNRIVIADIAPVAYRHSNENVALCEAMRALDLTGLDHRSEADRRLRTAVPDDGTRAFLLQSLDLRADPPRWRLNIDVLERRMDVITGWPSIGGLHAGGTLFLLGAESRYVRAEHRETIRQYFPAARIAKLPGAGHWLHADRPREFEAALRVFLD